MNPTFYQDISDSLYQLYKENLDHYGDTTYGMGGEVIMPRM